MRAPTRRRRRQRQRRMAASGGLPGRRGGAPPRRMTATMRIMGPADALQQHGAAAAGGVVMAATTTTARTATARAVAVAAVPRAGRNAAVGGGALWRMGEQLMLTVRQRGSAAGAVRLPTLHCPPAGAEAVHDAAACRVRQTAWCHRRRRRLVRVLLVRGLSAAVAAGALTWRTCGMMWARMTACLCEPPARRVEVFEL